MDDTIEQGSGATAPNDAPMETTAAATTAEELAAVRALALTAHPDAVPELVAGGSVAELIGSLEPARAAYRRIAEAIGAGVEAGAQATIHPVAPPVPAGAAPRLATDPDALPAAEKIRRGLAGRSGT